MAELADAADLKSAALKGAWGFESPSRHQSNQCVSSRLQIITDRHSPGEYRSDTVRNVEARYKAYGIARGDRLYLKPEDRVGIW